MRSGELLKATAAIALLSFLVPHSQRGSLAQAPRGGVTLRGVPAITLMRCCCFHFDARALAGAHRGAGRHGTRCVPEVKLHQRLVHDAIRVADLLLKQVQLLPRAAVRLGQDQVQIIGASFNHAEGLAQIMD